MTELERRRIAFLTRRFRERQGLRLAGVIAIEGLVACHRGSRDRALGVSGR